MSLGENLFSRFVRQEKRPGYASRLEGIKPLTGKNMVERKWVGNRESADAIVYDHHQRRLTIKIMDVQHHFEPRSNFGRFKEKDHAYP